MELNLFNLAFFPLLLSLIVSVATIFFLAFKGRKSFHLYVFLILMVLVSLWSLSELIVLIFGIKSSFHLKTTITVQYTFNCFIGFLWFVFCSIFTEKKYIKNKLVLLTLFVLPLSMYLLLLTNDYHHMFFRDQFYYPPSNYTVVIPGTFFWVHFVETFTFVISGQVFLFLYCFRVKGHLRKVTIVLSLAPMLSFITNILGALAHLLYIDFAVKSLQHGITPLGFALSLLLTVAATYKYMFINIIPMADKKIVESMKELIIVVSSYNKVLQFNKSFEVTFSEFITLKIDGDIKHFTNFLYTHINTPSTYRHIVEEIENPNETSLSGEIYLKEPLDVWYSVYIQPIKSSKTSGKIILLSDITEYKKMLIDFDKKNEKVATMNVELLDANKLLRDYSEKAEELAVYNERNRIFQDMQNTLGHSLVLVNDLLDDCLQSSYNSPEMIRKKIFESKSITKDGLRNLRRTIAGLKPHALYSSTLEMSLKELIGIFMESGIKFDFHIDGAISHIDGPVSNSILHICHEAITNSVKHGKADKIDIILQHVNSTIKLFIFDNGIGCVNINKGHGLAEIEFRVGKLGGFVIFGSNGEKGFNINIDIPIAKE